MVCQRRPANHPRMELPSRPGKGAVKGIRTCRSEVESESVNDGRDDEGSPCEGRDAAAELWISIHYQRPIMSVMFN